EEQTEVSGGVSHVVKPALTPSLLLPFAAGPVAGDLTSAGTQTEVQMRILFCSVERLMSALSGRVTETDVSARLHVVLPGSPNRGMFGGDGAYGEAKSALDAIVAKWRSEPGWAQRVTIAHAVIGWVRGTGLMGGNDPLVEQVEAKGVRTWSPDEIAVELLSAASGEARARADAEPLHVDLTGGLADVDLDLAALAGAQAEAGSADADGAADPAADGFAASVRATMEALPCPPEMRLGSTRPSWPDVTATPEE